MKISGLIPSSTLDFPGCLSAVIFSPGCNLDCFYCHNRSLLGKDAPVLEPAAVMAFLRKRQGLLDGVVFSGGEPLLQEGLEPFLREVRDLGYQIKLDSNGTRPGKIASLLKQELIDHVAIDYKVPWSLYPKLCRAALDDAPAVRESLDLLRHESVTWEARTTVIPQLREPELLSMARALPPLPQYYLQPYRRPEQYRKEDRFRVQAKALSPQELAAVAERIKVFQPQIKVRGAL